MPPPFVPSSLIASCDAAGASGSVCCVPSTAVDADAGLSDITTPVAMRTIATTKEIGSISRMTQRVRSTQKLPSRSVL